MPRNRRNIGISCGNYHATLTLPFRALEPDHSSTRHWGSLVAFGSSMPVAAYPPKPSQDVAVSDTSGLTTTRFDFVNTIFAGFSTIPSCVWPVMIASTPSIAPTKCRLALVAQ